MTDDLRAELLTVDEIFGDPSVSYEIPVYQRNYAWDAEQIEQLIDDIWTALLASEDSYFLGNLVVSRRSSVGAPVTTYEIVDGQQRLTTLYLLMKRLDMPVGARLTYASRRTATDALTNPTREPDEAAWSIHSGYKIIDEHLQSLVTDHKDQVKTFLSHHVHLVRAELPTSTELNRYFEIMNSRGQQLAQVDIVKARLMARFDSRHGSDTAEIGRRRRCFAWVWDACSDMDPYIQMSLTPGNTELRSRIFGKSWDALEIHDFASLLNARDFDSSATGVGASRSLREALDSYAAVSTTEPDEDPDSVRFEPPISFSSLLLHTLAVMENRVDDGDSALDDKRLVNAFGGPSAGEDGAHDIDPGDFIVALLRCRFVLDNFLLKREYTGQKADVGAWSLKRLTKGVSGNKQQPRYVSAFESDPSQSTEVEGAESATTTTRDLLLLQSMLRVTYTAPRSMHWITRALAAVDLAKDGATNASILADELRSYARSKVSDALPDEVDRTGFAIERIAFTYLDYLLAKGRLEGFPADRNFEFRFRNSIEHFFPQHPDPSTDGWDRITTEDPELHWFGNLALVSVSSNSKFSNALPEHKRDKSAIIAQSLKLKRMVQTTKDDHTWTKESIRRHHEEMVRLLSDDVRRGDETVP